MNKKQAKILYVMIVIILVCLAGAIYVSITGNKSDDTAAKTTEAAVTKSDEDKKTDAEDKKDDVTEAEDKSQDEAKDSKVESMMSELVPLMGLAKTVDLDSSKVEYYYELEEDDYVDARGVIGDVALADELVVIQAADSGKVDTVKGCAEERLKSQKSSFQDYIPEEYKRLDDAKIVVAGDYVLFVCSNNTSAIVDKFNELAGE